MDGPSSFAEFWPHYLRAHRHPTSRALHYVGTAGSLAALVTAISTENPWWIAFGAVFAYTCAWAGHFFVEGNMPLAFRRPLWSLLADYRMFILALTGKLGPHLERAGRA